MPKLPLAICISLAVALGGAAAPSRAAAPAGAAAPSGAVAEAPKRHEPVNPAARDAAARVTLKDATAIVRQAYGGRVLSATEAERRGADGKSERGYRFRVDVEGTVKTVFVDTRGRIHED